MSKDLDPYVVFFETRETILVWIWDVSGWLDLETTSLETARLEWFFVYFGEQNMRFRGEGFARWNSYNDPADLSPRMLDALDARRYRLDDIRPHPSFFRFLKARGYEFRSGRTVRVPPVGHVKTTPTIRSRRAWKEATT